MPTSCLQAGIDRFTVAAWQEHHDLFAQQMCAAELDTVGAPFDAAQALYETVRATLSKEQLAIVAYICRPNLSSQASLQTTPDLSQEQLPLDFHS